jgi:tetratricopeptide (TPR) repeat protein
MSVRALLVYTLMALVSPAHAALNVFGSTQARECYEAAIAGSGSGAALCERALANDQLTPRDKAATLVNRGIIYNAARQLDLAIADFNAALAIDPNLAEAYLNRGNAHLFRRQFPEAYADYSKAIDLKISNLDYAHYNRALASEMMGKLDDAKSDLTAALAITPNFKAASDRLAGLEQQIAARAAESPPPAVQQSSGTAPAAQPPARPQ